MGIIQTRSPRRAQLLSVNWTLGPDSVPRWSPCHFYTPAGRVALAAGELAEALCGAHPDTTLQARSASASSADYAPSKADCRPCCQAIGEELRSDRPPRARAPRG